jgi:porin
MRFVWIALLGLLLLVPAVAVAQPYDVPPTWGGDLWSRPRLTGSWFGLRDELGKKGVVFDVDLLLTPQSVMTGGHDTGSEFWGNADYTLNVDTGKLGLWPGGFLKVSADSGFGRNVLVESGSIVRALSRAILSAALTPVQSSSRSAPPTASRTR